MFINKARGNFLVIKKIRFAIAQYLRLRDLGTYRDTNGSEGGSTLPWETVSLREPSRPAEVREELAVLQAQPHL